MPVTNYGPNLQQLVDNKVIKPMRARNLRQDKRDAIENLTAEEIATLIKVFNDVGRSENMWMI